jgi:hypothetical protein
VSRSLRIAVLAVSLASLTAIAPAQGLLGKGGWLDPWVHRHANSRGTPFLHAFGLEPAFLERDVILDFRRVTSESGREFEVEGEVEWAFTRRLGVVFEVPFLHVNEKSSQDHTGFGDLAIAPRVLLVDADEFLMSFNLAVAVDTGDEDRGLGAGETRLAPSFSFWMDLLDIGECPLTFQVQVGTEHGLSSGDTALFYNGALALAFLGAHEGHPEHLPEGTFFPSVELTGRTVLDGPDESTTAELLFGAGIAVTEQLVLRAGYIRSIGGPEEIDDGFTVGGIYHF